MTTDVSQLVLKLSSSDVELKTEAAQELAQRGEAAQEAAVPLVKAAGDHEESVREWVVAALESLGQPAVSDLPAFRELVSSEHPDVTYWAITLIGRLETQAAPAVPELIEALSSENPHPHNRQRAAWALAKLGPAASEALPALKNVAHDADSRLARFALRAIEEISPSPE